MSIFEQTKETMLLLITVFVLIFVTVFFYVILGNYGVGSELNVYDRETELVVLRTLKCIDNNENLNDCIKTGKYGIRVQFDDNKILYVNEKLFEEIHESSNAYFVYYLLNNKPAVTVVFKK